MEPPEPTPPPPAATQPHVTTTEAGAGAAAEVGFQNVKRQSIIHQHFTRHLTLC